MPATDEEMDLAWDSFSSDEQEVLKTLQAEISGFTQAGYSQNDIKNLLDKSEKVSGEATALYYELHPSIPNYGQNIFFPTMKSVMMVRIGLVSFAESKEELEGRRVEAKTHCERLESEEERLQELKHSKACLATLRVELAAKKAKVDKANQKFQRIKAQSDGLRQEIDYKEMCIMEIDRRLNLDQQMPMQLMQQSLDEYSCYSDGRRVGVSLLDQTKAALDSVKEELSKARKKARDETVIVKSSRVELAEVNARLYGRLAKYVTKLAEESEAEAWRRDSMEAELEQVLPGSAAPILARFDPEGGGLVNSTEFAEWLKSNPEGGADGQVESDEYDTPPPGPDPDSDFGDIEAASLDPDPSRPTLRILYEPLLGEPFLTVALRECQTWLKEKDKKLKAWKLDMHEPKMTLNFMSEDRTKAKVSIFYGHDASGGMKSEAFSKFTLKREAAGEWVACAMNWKGGSWKKQPLPELPVDMDTTIGTLKDFVAERFGAPREALLLYGPAGQLWDESKTVKDYGLKFADVIRANANARPAVEMGGPEELEELKRRFTFKGKIDKTEERGITVSQLNQVLDFVKSRSGAWRDMNKYSATCGWTLEANSINLYHVNSGLILPATKADNCALVELFTGERQPPKNFVSHWWGEPVSDFIRCVEHHAELRGNSEQDAYWVCAYANRQHDLGAELTVDPRETSFYKAMALADGVLLILDAKNEYTATGPATPFTRVWCCFEESVAVGDTEREVPLYLDIATAIVEETGGLKPVVLTEGLVGKEKEIQGTFDGGAWGAKNRREMSFPTEVLSMGLDVDILKSAASVAGDKRHILNSIAGVRVDKLDDDPQVNSEKYDLVNKRLAGIFAVSGFRAAIQSGIPLDRYVAALKKDDGRTDLKMSFEGMKDFSSHRDVKAFEDEHLIALGEAIAGAQSLKTLDLNFNASGYINASAMNEFGAMICKSQNLERIRISIDHGKGWPTMGQSLGELQKLRHLVIESDHWNQDSTDFLDGLDRCVALQKLELILPGSFSSNGSWRDWKKAGRTIGGMKALEELKFSFKGSMGINFHAPRDLSKGIRKLTNLLSFHLDFSDCSMINQEHKKLWTDKDEFLKMFDTWLLYSDDPVEVFIVDTWETMQYVGGDSKWLRFSSGAERARIHEKTGWEMDDSGWVSAAKHNLELREVQFE
eukprot:TRINITY_DN14212_c0_g1_i1.p1 TRINITY_DN14212_c0_g1~~TRINITY_DN14212_c0_g1_i1.p1  ORF type:complete len:1172 (-),score=274.47 TRINITY_DN14212_c0_g1_i1:33-3548(-)